MLVANKTPGTVYLSHGLDREVPTVRFRPVGDRDSVQELVDTVWAGSRNLNRLVSQGVLELGEGVVELPSPPASYNVLPKWDRQRVRMIVLGTEDEFEKYGIITPLGSTPGSPERVDQRYIKNHLIPAIEISLEWLEDLKAATKRKEYTRRISALKKHMGELKELL